MTRTFTDIANAVYQHGPLDWDELEQRAQVAHRFDPANPVLLTADQAVILLECMRELQKRDAVVQPDRWYTSTKFRLPDGTIHDTAVDGPLSPTEAGTYRVVFDPTEIE